ncbi:MAG: MFS transporter [Vicinamibacterales bacterium]
MLSRLLARVGLVTPEQRAWAWYDCGNSAYFTTVITAVFPAFFATYAAAGLAPGEATTRFGVITTMGMAIVAVLAPILGAYGDYAARRKPLLVGCAAVGIAATFALTTITEGGWQWAALIFVVGNVGVSGSLVFYDSMLPSVAAPDETDRVSAAGYALGYLGGGLLLVLNLAWVLQPAWFGLSGTVAAIRLSFASVGVWWLLFLLPLLRHVPEPPRLAAPGEADPRGAVRASFARLAHTFVEIRQYKQAFLALLAMLVYQDGIQTIIRFAGIYGAEVGVGQSAQIAAFAMVQLVGVPFAFLFGSLGPRLGTRRAILVALAVYTVAAVLGYFMQNATHFFLIAGLVATVQGGAQALSRSLFARLIPPAKTSEYFGFYAVVERFATILGPLVFTLSGAVTGSARSAVLGMIVFFVAGAWLLMRVDVEAGERAARAG